VTATARGLRYPPRHELVPLSLSTSGGSIVGGEPLATSPTDEWWHVYGGFLEVASPVAGSWLVTLYLAGRPDANRCVFVANAQLGAAGTSSGNVSPRFIVPPGTPLTPFFLDFYGATSWRLVLFTVVAPAMLTDWS
jgi:hypothetical protein